MQAAQPSSASARPARAHPTAAPPLARSPDGSRPPTGARGFPPLAGCATFAPARRPGLRPARREVPPWPVPARAPGPCSPPAPAPASCCRCCSPLPGRPAPRRRARRAREEPVRGRHRRRGQQRRPRRDARRHAGAARRRQRRGRRHRHGGRARRDRAVLRGHRRRRLPRRLRRPDRPGDHVRRPRGRAGDVRPGRVHGRRRRAARLRDRREQRPVGRGARHPGAVVARRPRARDPPARRAAAAGRAPGPRGLRRRRDVRPADPDNEARFRLFPETARVYLPGGEVPAVGSTFRNPGLARAYRVLGEDGVRALYRGRIGRAVVQTARDPQTADGVEVPPGRSPAGTCATTACGRRRRRCSTYRGLEVVGMPVPSSGGLAVGEALNLLEAYDAKTGRALPDVSRGAVPAPLRRGHRHGLRRPHPLHRRRAGRAGRASCCRRTSPTSGPARCSTPTGRPPGRSPPGSPDGDYGCRRLRGTAQVVRDEHGTTHLTAVDASGSVASYTLTIEQTGGSGITVPGWGFLLNNELTDFEFVPPTPGVPHPNLPGPGKRPRSSMAPTIVLEGGEPVLGARLARRLDDHHDRGAGADRVRRPRPHAAAGGGGAAAVLAQQPRRRPSPPCSRAGSATGCRPRATCCRRSRSSAPSPRSRCCRGGRLQAVAEPTRRGGGAAMVVEPAR